MDTSCLLEIKDFSLTYNQAECCVPALDRVSLTLGAGESLGIIGESGCGKTSLAMAVMGLARSAQISGQIRFQGRELTAMDRKDYKKIRWNRIALTFQNSQEVFNPVLTVGRQVEEALTRHLDLGKSEARIRTGQLFALVGLDPCWQAAYPHQLSGGMRQRVLIAMAVSCSPDLLIVDEPFTALDAEAREAMAGLLRSLQEKLGFSMILISHAMPAIARLTQRTLTLYAGQVLETGPTKEVMADPCHPYTRGLINACPEFYGYKDLWGIPGIPPMPGQARGCPFFPRCVQHGTACETSRPPLVPAGSGRRVACHKGGIATVLEGRGLEKGYELNGKTVKAVQRADIRIKSAEVVALVGPSGSGKSTLAHLLVALEKPDRGRITFRGDSLSGPSASACMGGIQLVFQDPAQAVSPRLTVMEAVREPLDILGWGTAPARNEKALAAVSLVHLPCDPDFMNRPCHALSGGQRQRIGVARALVTDPVLLIADEITAMLDPSAQAHLLRQLKSLQHKKGFSMLFITHDLHLARKIADRAYVLKDGRITAEGSGQEVFESFAPDRPGQNRPAKPPEYPETSLSPAPEGAAMPTYT